MAFDQLVSAFDWINQSDDGTVVGYEVAVYGSDSTAEVQKLELVHVEVCKPDGGATLEDACDYADGLPATVNEKLSLGVSDESCAVMQREAYASLGSVGLGKVRAVAAKPSGIAQRP